MSGVQPEEQNSQPENEKEIVSQLSASLSLSNSVRSKIDNIEKLEKSWLFLFCARCNGTTDLPDSWEPEGWRRACPRPFCPSYRKFSRIVGLTLIGLLTWGVTIAILGRNAVPGGQLFGLAALAIVAHLAGWLVSLVNLPGLLGMLLTGIIMQNTGLVHITGGYVKFVSHLRRIALVIILTRAGLNLDPKAMKAFMLTLPKMDLIPWTFEVGVLAFCSHYLLGLPWTWATMLASINAAVSPAVVVPCLFKLRAKGYGVDKGIPTLLIAIAGIDGVASIVFFGILQSVMFSENDLWDQIYMVPIAVFGGIGFGLISGIIFRYIPENKDPFVVHLRVLMLLGTGLLASFGSKVVNLEGAGPLAIVTAAFVSCYFWQKDGWSIQNNPVSVAFEIFWMIFEPILFSVTGTQIILSKLDGNTVYLGSVCLLIGIIARMLITVFVGVGSNFNFKEKIFIALACMAKATVQAALGPALLEKIDEPVEEYKRFGDIVLVVSFLSILLTAPVGAFIIMLSGPKLLKKTLPRAPQDNQVKSNKTYIHEEPVVKDCESVISSIFKISDNVELSTVSSPSS